MPASPNLSSRRQATVYAVASLLWMGSLSLTTLRSQGIERESLAGESAEVGAKGSDVNQAYNLQLGPVNVRMDSSLATSYNDNINLAHTGRVGDFIVTPAVGIHGLWQATDLNTLTFDLGVGYQWYTMHSANSSVYVTPNTAAQFNIYAGDFRINLHDRMSYSSNPIMVGQLSNVSEFPVFDNIAGVGVDWDLGDIILSLGYDHQNQWVFDSAYSYLTYQSDTVSPKITFNISKTIKAGLMTSFSSMRYNQNVQNNSTALAAGPFVNAQLTDNLAVNAQMGANLANYDTGGLNGDNSNLSSFYFNAGVSNRINDVFSQSLTGGREFIPGISSNYTQRLYANYAFNWQATQYINFGPNLWWENLADSNATFSQTANRYGAGFDIAYNVTDRSNLDLNYQYVLKDSNPGDLSYEQDVVTLKFRYQF